MDKIEIFVETGFTSSLTKMLESIKLQFNTWKDANPDIYVTNINNVGSVSGGLGLIVSYKEREVDPYDLYVKSVGIEKLVVKFKKLPHFENDAEDDLQLPKYAHDSDAGADIQAANYEPIIIRSHTTELIPTGFCTAIPEGYEAQVRPRSGIAIKNSITMLNSPATIDASYRNEWKVPLYNAGTDRFIVNRGMKIAQVVFNKVAHADFQVVEELDETLRNLGGFGSTGI